MIKITGADIVAIVLIIGCFTMIGMGKNHVVEYVLLSVASGYGIVKVRPRRGKRG